MFKIIKYLRHAKIEVLFIVLFLIVQAYCDLALPSYMSDIVNIGINGNGVDEKVPDKITEYGLAQICAYMTKEDEEFVMDSYKKTGKKLDDVTISIAGMSQMPEDMSQEASQSMPTEVTIEDCEYELKDDADKDKLTDIMSGPMTIMGLINQAMESGADFSGSSNEESSSDNSIKDMMSDEQLEAMMTMMMPTSTQDDKAKALDAFLDGFEMKDTIVSTYVPMYIAGQYDKCGIDMNDYQKSYLIVMGLKMLGFALVGMVAAIAVGFIASRVGAKTAMNLRNSVFRRVVSFSNAEMDKFSTASLITRSTNDIQQIQMVITLLLRMVLYAPILCVGGILKVVNTDLSMAWIIVVGAVIIVCFVMLLFVIAMPKFKLMQKLIDNVNLVAREILTGLSVIRVFTRDEHEQKRFEKANIELYKTQLFTNRVMTFMMPVMMLVMNGISLAIVWFGAKGIDNGNIKMGDMMAFITYSMMVVISFLMLTMMSIIIPRASVAANRVDEILETPITIKDCDSPRKSNNEGVIEFKNVNFKYPNAEDNVLENISFTAMPGKTTAIIGSTGSGKSTLVNLIPRLYDVNEGEILIDGVNIKEMTKHDLRSNMGVVPQKGVLFSGTISSNIRYGNENATDEDVVEAAAIAQATEFIEAKEERYDSEIAQGGNNVSGGQKQRLAIARAIAKKPQILVFDDSFSALDFKTDKALRKALATHTSHATVLIVAQRISTILNADTIIVLDDGKIAGMGTHKELLKNCEVYMQIAQSQLSQKEINATLGIDNENGKVVLS